MTNLENYMKQQSVLCEQNDSINKNLYAEYGVKRGLRDENGQGVLTGLTNISNIKAFDYHDGENTRVTAYCLIVDTTLKIWLQEARANDLSLRKAHIFFYSVSCRAKHS